MWGNKVVPADQKVSQKEKRSIMKRVKGRMNQSRGTGCGNEEAGNDAPPTEFPGYRIFQNLEFLDINPTILRAMTCVGNDFLEDSVSTTTDFGQKKSKNKLKIRQDGSRVWNHRSRSRQLLKLTMFLFSLYSVLVYPVVFAFGSGMTPFLYKINLLQSVLYLLDMYGSTFTTFRAPNGTLVRDRSRILHRYLGSYRFFVDTAAALPAGIMYPTEEQKTNFFIDWNKTSVRTVSAGLVLHLIILLAKYLRELRYARRVRLGVYYSAGIIASQLVVFLHVSVTGYFLCCQTSYSGWFKREVEFSTKREPESFFFRYVVFMGGTVSFLFGDGVATTTPERIYKMAMNVIGIFGTAAIVGQVTHLIHKRNATATKWKLKIDEVSESMRQMGIDPQLQNRIRNYYAFSWALNGGDDSKHQWLNDLSDLYRREALIQVNERLIASMPLFRDAPKKFLQAIIFHFKEQLCLPGDYIIRYGEIGDRMFFLVRGSVQALDKDETTVYTRLEDGAFFGEIALLRQNSRRTATVRSFTYSQLNVLHKSDFEAILKENPEQAFMLEREAISRERHMALVRSFQEKIMNKMKKREKSGKQQHGTKREPEGVDSALQDSPTSLHDQESTRAQAHMQEQVDGTETQAAHEDLEKKKKKKRTKEEKEDSAKAVEDQEESQTDMKNDADVGEDRVYSLKLDGRKKRTRTTLPDDSSYHSSLMNVKSPSRTLSFLDAGGQVEKFVESISRSYSSGAKSEE